MKLTTHFPLVHRLRMHGASSPLPQYGFMTLYLVKYRDFTFKLKVKVKLSLCFNGAPRHEGELRSGGIAPSILALCTRWRGVVSFTIRPRYPPPPQGISLWYTLDRNLGGPQSRFGSGGEEKDSQSYRDSNPIPSSPQHSAIPLSYPDSYIRKIQGKH
jgi:hypothetical protein